MTTVNEKALDGVDIRVVGYGGQERTRAGVARLALSSEIKSGMEIQLEVVNRNNEEWVFISPWGHRLIVPPFGEGRFVSVVLAHKADQEALLGSSAGRQAILQSILSKLNELLASKSSLSEEQRRAVLKEQSAAFGLMPEQVDAALREAAARSPDLYEQGLAALYQRNYSLASQQLGQAATATEKELKELERAREQTRKKLGDQSFFLGVALESEGRYREAVVAFRRSLEMRGEDAATLNSLGEALREAGDLSESAAILERARAAHRTDSDRLALAIQTNLAATLAYRGDLGGAQKLQEQVLAVRRRVLGAEHPDTLGAMGNLAATIEAQGDLAGARKLQEQTLEGMRRVLGAEHPDTLTAMSNLASTRRDQGDLAGARKLQEKVLELRRRVLGAEHPDTLNSMDNLANTLSIQGDLSGASTLRDQVLLVQRRVLGAEHPNTLNTMSNLAATMQRQGNLAGARKLQEQVLEIRRRVLGAEHLDTLIAMNNLASTLSDQKDLAGARKLQEQTLEIMRRVLGPEHPYSVGAMSNLGETLVAQGDLAGARKVQEQVLEVRRRVLGPKHSDTSVAAWNLLKTCRALKDEGGARELEASLDWLLTADEASLSADQRDIRRGLQDHK